MEEGTVPLAGMTISLRTREDVVIVDPERFLAAARQAYRKTHPEAGPEEAAQAVRCAEDAVWALYERNGERGLLPGEHSGWQRRFRPGSRATDRPDGLSPGGQLQEVVFDEPKPLQDYGCFLPEDLFARRQPGDPPAAAG